MTDLQTTELPKTRPPLPAFLLVTSAFVPIAAGPMATFLVRGRARRWMFDLTRLWSAGIVCFLAGVRRGLSFATPGGAKGDEIGASLLVFFLGFLGLVLRGPAALVALMLGFGSVGVLDSRAAHRLEAPRFFGPLRPLQAAVAVAALGFLLTAITRRDDD